MRESLPCTCLSMSLKQNRFYDLAALPDLQMELRDEIREALSQSGGKFTSNALQSMKKMDSFLKETLRVHPATMGKA
jgi:cytochrome P450